MDPHANIAEQLSLAASIIDSYDNDNERVDEHDAARLAELVIALDEWRKAGGFNPYKS